MKKFIAISLLLFATLIVPITLHAQTISGQNASGLSPNQIDSIVALLQAFGADQSVITSVSSDLNGTSVSSASSAGQSFCYNWSNNFGEGSANSEDIAALHQALAAQGFATTDQSTVYGNSTVSAVSDFQQKYASSILAPSGLSRGTGYIGSVTRTELNGLYGCSNQSQSVQLMNPVSAVSQNSSAVPSQATPTQAVPGAGDLILSVSASPGAQIVADGSQGITIGSIDFHAPVDPIILQRLGLVLTTGNPQDIKNITIWNGSTQVGTASFFETDLTTAHFSPAILVATSSDIVLTLEANFNQVGFAGAENGDVDTVSYDSNDPANTEGIDQTDENTVDATGTALFSPITVTNGIGTNLTVTSSTTTASSQNVSINVPNQVLGEFNVTLTNEPVSVQTMTFHITANQAINSVTNIVLADTNGTVIAGPVNATAGYGSQTATFSTQVTFPVGTSSYLLEGTLPIGTPNYTRIFTTTLPSSDWSEVTGQTGNTIDLSGLPLVSMSPVTVRVGSLAINDYSSSLLPGIASQTILAGRQQTLAGYILDTTQSGESITLPSITLNLAGSGSPSNLTRCALWNNNAVLNSQNPVNPTSYGNQIFEFDNPLTVSAGTTTALYLTCGVSANATGSYQWGITTAPQIVTGVSSGLPITATIPSTNNGAIMTIGTGGSVVSPQFTQF